MKLGDSLVAQNYVSKFPSTSNSCYSRGLTSRYCQSSSFYQQNADFNSRMGCYIHSWNRDDYAGWRQAWSACPSESDDGPTSGQYRADNSSFGYTSGKFRAETAELMPQSSACGSLHILRRELLSTRLSLRRNHLLPIFHLSVPASLSSVNSSLTFPLVRSPIPLPLHCQIYPLLSARLQLPSRPAASSC
jgi:hypothetical protein